MRGNRYSAPVSDQLDESHETRLELAQTLFRLALLQQSTRRFDDAEQAPVKPGRWRRSLSNNVPCPTIASCWPMCTMKNGVFLLLGKETETAEVAIRNALSKRADLATNFPSVPHYRAAYPHRKATWRGFSARPASWRKRNRPTERRLKCCSRWPRNFPRR